MRVSSVFSSLLLAVACGQKQPPATLASAPQAPVQASAVAPGLPPAQPEEAAPTAVTTAPLSEDDAFAKMSLEELNASQPLPDVRFAYDQYELTLEARVTLQRHAEWLKRWERTQIRVEGHADERGTAEYNLALGERRAVAIRTYLVDLGIADSRITLVSKGEEDPACTERHDTCWSMNRRGHFIITAK